MTYRFSGIWDFEIINSEVDEEDDYEILCENPIIDANDEIDFNVDIKKFIMENKDFTILNDGYYHCYFNGLLWWEYSENHEFGTTDYELWTNINYFNIFKMK